MNRLRVSTPPHTSASAREHQERVCFADEVAINLPSVRTAIRWDASCVSQRHARSAVRLEICVADRNVQFGHDVRVEVRCAAPARSAAAAARCGAIAAARARARSHDPHVTPCVSQCRPASRRRVRRFDRRAAIHPRRDHQRRHARGTPRRRPVARDQCRPRRWSRISLRPDYPDAPGASGGAIAADAHVNLLALLSISGRSRGIDGRLITRVSASARSAPQRAVARVRTTPTSPPASRPPSSVRRDTITLGGFAAACASTAAGLRRRRPWSRPAAPRPCPCDAAGDRSLRHRARHLCLLVLLPRARPGAAGRGRRAPGRPLSACPAIMWPPPDRDGEQEIGWRS